MVLAAVEVVMEAATKSVTLSLDALLRGLTAMMLLLGFALHLAHA